MSNGPWTRCTTTGAPRRKIDGSNWIDHKDPRHSFQTRFPGMDVFCLNCMAIIAEYNPEYLKNEVIFSQSNSLQIGSAMVVSGIPSDGYVFAGCRAHLHLIGEFRRQQKGMYRADVPRSVGCPACSHEHKLYWTTGNH